MKVRVRTREELNTWLKDVQGEIDLDDQDYRRGQHYYRKLRLRDAIIDRLLELGETPSSLGYTLERGVEA